MAKPPLSFNKPPAESKSIGIDYTGRLPSGVAPQSGTVSAKDLSDGSDASATVLASTTATITGNQARVRVKNGAHGERYAIIFTTTHDNNDIDVDCLIMRVLDPCA